MANLQPVHSCKRCGPVYSKPEQHSCDRCHRYNGWANYETWLVHLWLSNEEGSYYAAREIAADGTVGDAADALKDWLEDIRPELGGASLWLDLLRGALSGVDWLEVAEAFREE